jgi:hypothetical protein
MVLSQEIGVATPHFLFALSIVQGFVKSDEHWFLQTPVSREHCRRQFLGDRVKACHTVSTLPSLVEL